MTAHPTRVSELAEFLPPIWPQPLLPEIQARLADGNRTLVVLDDDPTGTQTVHDVAVLTEWSVDALNRELARREPVFFVLTNSRSLPLDRAQALNGEVGRNLGEASRLSGRDVAVVSRSDSTLRGHYPGEVEALATALGQPFDATLIVPFFLEGGRYTIGDTHYVAEGDVLTPAADTPFAQDAVFGYRSSNLRKWVEEKTGGRVPAAEVQSVSIELLRTSGPHAVTELLMTLVDDAVCVVNAAGMRDMEVFVSGLMEAETRGKRFLYRTAASFVQVRAGIASRPLLTATELALPPKGGALFVAGSHVPKTTAQVNALLKQAGIIACELHVESLLDPADRDREIARAVAQIDAAISRGEDVALYTSRRLVTGDGAAENLRIGQQVSTALVAVVRGLRTRPRYLVAKGGITSSDIATEALKMRRAIVLGQVLPGVPVWQAGPESLHPGLVYVVFPGNVGGDDALVQLLQLMEDIG